MQEPRSRNPRKLGQIQPAGPVKRPRDLFNHIFCFHVVVSFRDLRSRTSQHPPVPRWDQSAPATPYTVQHPPNRARNPPRTLCVRCVSFPVPVTNQQPPKRDGDSGPAPASVSSQPRPLPPVVSQRPPVTSSDKHTRRHQTSERSGTTPHHRPRHRPTVTRGQQ